MRKGYQRLRTTLSPTKKAKKAKQSSLRTQKLYPSSTKNHSKNTANMRPSHRRVKYRDISYDEAVKPSDFSEEVSLDQNRDFPTDEEKLDFRSIQMDGKRTQLEEALIKMKQKITYFINLRSTLDHNAKSFHTLIETLGIRSLEQLSDLAEQADGGRSNEFLKYSVKEKSRQVSKTLSELSSESERFMRSVKNIGAELNHNVLDVYALYKRTFDGAFSAMNSARDTGRRSRRVGRGESVGAESKSGGRAGSRSRKRGQPQDGGKRGALGVERLRDIQWGTDSAVSKFFIVFGDQEQEEIQRYFEEQMNVENGDLGLLRGSGHENLGGDEMVIVEDSARQNVFQRRGRGRSPPLDPKVEVSGAVVREGSGGRGRSPLPPPHPKESNLSSDKEKEVALLDEIKENLSSMMSDLKQNLKSDFEDKIENFMKNESSELDAEVNDKIGFIKNRVSGLESSLEQLRKFSKNLEIQQLSVSNLESENEKLARELRATKSRLSEFQEEAISLKNQLSLKDLRLKQSKHDKAKIERLQRELKTLEVDSEARIQEQKSSSAKRLEEFKSKLLEEFEQEMEFRNEKSMDLHNEMDEMRSTFDQKILRIQTENGSLKDQNMALEMKLSMLKTKFDKLRGDYQEKVELLNQDLLREFQDVGCQIGVVDDPLAGDVDADDFELSALTENKMTQTIKILQKNKGIFTDRLIQRRSFGAQAGQRRLKSVGTNTNNRKRLNSENSGDSGRRRSERRVREDKASKKTPRAFASTQTVVNLSTQTIPNLTLSSERSKTSEQFKVPLLTQTTSRTLLTYRPPPLTSPKFPIQAHNNNPSTNRSRSQLSSIDRIYGGLAEQMNQMTQTELMRRFNKKVQVKPPVRASKRCGVNTISEEIEALSETIEARDALVEALGSELRENGLFFGKAFERFSKDFVAKNLGSRIRSQIKGDMNSLKLTLETRIQRYELKIENLKNSLFGIKKVARRSQNQLKLNINNLKAKVNRLQTSSAKLEGEKSELGSEISKLKKEAKSLKKLNKQSAMDIETKDKVEDQLNIKLTKQSTEIEGLNSLIDDLKIRVSELENIVKITNQEKMTFARTIKDLENQLKGIKEEKITLRCTIEDLEGSLSEMNLEKTELEKRLKASKEEKDDLEEGLKVSKEQKEALSRAVEQLEASISELNQEKALLDSDLAEVSHEKNHLKNEVERIRDEKKVLTSNIEELESSIARLNEEKAELCNTIQGLEQASSKGREEKSDLRNALDDKEAEIQALNLKIADLSSAVEELQTNLQNEEKSAEELRGQLKTHSDKLANLQEEQTVLIEAQKVELEGLKEQTHNQEKQLRAEKEAEIDTLSKKLAKSESQATEKESHLKEAREQKKAFYKNLNQILQGKGYIKSNDQFEDVVETIQGALARVEDKGKQSLEFKQKEVDRVKVRLDEALGEKRALKEQVGGLKIDLSRLKSQNQMLETELGASKAHIESLSESNKKALEKGQKVGSNLRSIEGQLDDARSEIKGLNLRIIELDGEIRAKETELEGVRETLEERGLEMQEVRQQVSEKQRDFEQLLEQFEANNRELEDTQKGLSNAKFESQSVAGELEALKAVKDGLESELEQVSEKCSLLEKRVEEKEQEVAMTRKRLQGENKELQGRLGDKDDELKAAKKEFSKIEKKLKSEVKDKENELKIAKKDSNKAERRFKDEAREKDSELSTLKTKHSREVTKLKKELEETEEELAALQKHFENTTTKLEREVEAKGSEAGQTKNELLLTKKELENLKSELKATRSQLSSTNQEEKAYYMALIEEKDALIKEQSDQSYELLTKIQKLEDQQASLSNKANMDRLQHQREISSTRKQKGQMAEDLAAANKDLNDLTEQLRDLKEQLREAEDKKGEILGQKFDLEAQIKKMNEEHNAVIETMNDKVIEFGTQINLAQEENYRLEVKNQKLVEKLKEAVERLKEKGGESRGSVEASERNDQLERQYQKLEDKYDTLKQEFEQMNIEYLEREDFVEELKNGIENKTNLIEVQEEEIRKLESRIDELEGLYQKQKLDEKLVENLVFEKSRTKKLKGMIGIMNIKLNKLKTRNDKLTRSNKNLKEEREMFMDSNQRLVGVNKKKEVEVNLLTSQLNMSMDNNQLRSSMRQLTKKVSDLESEKTQMQISVTRLDQQVTTLTQNTKQLELNLKDEAAKRYALKQVLMCAIDPLKDDTLKQKLIDFADKLDFNDKIDEDFDDLVSFLQKINVESMINDKSKLVALELERMKEKYYMVKENLKTQVESSEFLAKQIILSQRGNKEFYALEKLIISMGEALMKKNFDVIENSIYEMLAKVDYDSSKINSIIKNMSKILKKG